MSRGEHIRSHSESNQELFNKLSQYSAEFEDDERKVRRGQAALDAYFSQFDHPSSRRDPQDIEVKLYDPDAPEPESEELPKTRINNHDTPKQPDHPIEIKLYGSDPESHERKESSAYELLSPQEAKDVFNQTGFKDLEAMNFISENAAPKYKLEKIGGADIYLSEVIPDRKRPHVVAYIKAEGSDIIEPRTFYRSRSSMLWRFLPQLRENGGYGKSNYGEDAINAPFELQSTMEQIYTDEQKDPDHISKFGDYKSIRKLCTDIEKNLEDPRIPYAGGEGDLSGIIRSRNVNGKNSLTPSYSISFDDRVQLPDPRSCTVSQDLSPDFSQVEGEWQTENDVYGKTTARRFRSRDGSLEYLIFQTAQGRAWIGAVECVNSKVTSTGLREEFVSPGALTTPLYEYAKQAEGEGGVYWGNLNDQKDHYVGMDRYLNNIPLLQEFHQHF